MTTQPPAPDWYPDPSGKPGLMYWDGQQWHKNIPETPAPAHQRPAEPISATPQPRSHAARITATWVAIAALVGLVAVTGYVLLKQAQRSQHAVAQPKPAPSAPTMRPAPPSGQNPSLAPPSASTAGSSYLKTSWGTSCQVTAEQVTCQTCVPGQVITNAYSCTDPAPAVAVNTAGIVNRNPADIGSFPGAQQLSTGQTYHLNGWTIVVSGGWARFINDGTGHGMAVAAQNFDSF
ncbi:DUF2510 domain-containing protein [Mycobacterium noviomagense]|nr:DUF2510 domain-containing protein [Mycobacterium noviomagense]BBY05043.1 hypothetical protein MNVI_03610 [Mycobacterium noviomagense]